MYMAHVMPATSASRTPSASHSPPPAAALLASRTPAAEMRTQSRWLARREPKNASASGPAKNSIVTTTPSGRRSIAA
jgi:hypothetical protein